MEITNKPNSLLLRVYLHRPNDLIIPRLSLRLDNLTKRCNPKALLQKSNHFFALMHR